MIPISKQYIVQNDEPIKAKDLFQAALLKIMQEKRFVQISISLLCEKAGVSRTTFYKNYRNTSEVLDDVIDRIVDHADTLDHAVLGLHAATGGKIPFCELIRSEPTLRCLLFDPEAAGRVVEKNVVKSLEAIKTKRVLTQEEEKNLKDILYCAAYGCLAMSTLNANVENDEWRRMRLVRDEYVSAGIKQFLLKAESHRSVIHTSVRDYLITISPSQFMKESGLKEQHEHLDGTGLVRAALQNPIGCSLRKAVHPGEKVALITNDTGPFPANVVLPEILHELEEAGIPDDDICIVFAIGRHNPLSKEDMIQLVGDKVFNRYHCVNSNPEDVIDLGCTVRGTPLEITRVVQEADFRICTGNVEYSNLTGYTGGRNPLIPGCCSVRTISANHRELCSGNVCPGKRKGNPIYEDLSEAGNLITLNYLVNVVLNTKNEIVYAVAGEPDSVHDAAIEILDRRCRRVIREEAGLVIVGCSEGKDKTLEDLVTAAAHVIPVVRYGGTVVLVGSCKDGFGSEAFEQSMKSETDPLTVLKRVCTSYDQAGARSAVLARLCVKADVYLVSELDPEEVSQTVLKPCDSIQKIIDRHHKGKILVLQDGDKILPEVQKL